MMGSQKKADATVAFGYFQKEIGSEQNLNRLVSILAVTFHDDRPYFCHPDLLKRRTINPNWTKLFAPWTMHRARVSSPLGNCVVMREMRYLPRGVISSTARNLRSLTLVRDDKPRSGTVSQGEDVYNTLLTNSTLTYLNTVHANH